jgi:4,5-DOPA dioxygenase extradiol
MRFPAVFLSHGAPTIALEDVSETRAWAALADELPRPREILCISAHWDTAQPAVSTTARPETIHDFFGFPPQLYEVRYPAPGAPALAERVATRLVDAGLSCAIDAARGLDHGAWVPLKWMYPAADIPVTQLSVQSRQSPRHHHALGRALADLRDEDVLILASGGIVHNLRELEWHLRGQREPIAWARGFNDWIAARVADGDLEALIDYRRSAPDAARSHPTEEHFDPFFVAMGAGGFPARRLELGFDLGSLGMDGYVFGATA